MWTFTTNEFTLSHTDMHKCTGRDLLLLLFFFYLQSMYIIVLLHAIESVCAPALKSFDLSTQIHTVRQQIKTKKKKKNAQNRHNYAPLSLKFHNSLNNSMFFMFNASFHVLIIILVVVVVYFFCMMIMLFIASSPSNKF